MKRRYRIAIYIGLSVIGILLALVAGLFGVLQTGYARDQLRQRIADATAGSSTAVQLDAIEGVVPFDMQLVGLRLSDRVGTWLTADRVSLAWSPSAGRGAPGFFSCIGNVTRSPAARFVRSTR